MTREQAVEIRNKIELASSTMSDENALTAVELFPIWKVNTAYEMGIRVQYNGVLYKCNQSHTSQSDWTPSATPALWSEVSIEEWAEWKQPTGAHDAYNTGDKCSYNGKHYICTVDGNIYAPDVYGWEEVAG